MFFILLTQKIVTAFNNLFSFIICFLCMFCSFFHIFFLDCFSAFFARFFSNFFLLFQVVQDIFHGFLGGNCSFFRGGGKLTHLSFFQNWHKKITLKITNKQRFSYYFLIFFSFHVMIKESCNNMFYFSKEKGGEISISSIGAYMCVFSQKFRFFLKI